MARWKGKKYRITTAFVLALLFGDEVDLDDANENTPGAMDTWGDEQSYALVIDEGRRQLDSQSERYRHATDRAQAVLTVALVGFAFSLGNIHRVTQVDYEWHRAAAAAFSYAGILLLLLGIASAAAVIAVKASFGAIDATVLSNEHAPNKLTLATHYASAVRRGEATVAARLTMLRQAVRFVCWGVVVSSIGLALTF